MAEKKECNDSWIKFIKRHGEMTMLLAGFIAVASIAALMVFLNFVADAQSTGLVPAGLGEWTVAYCVTFFLNLILWELVFVGSWVIVLTLIIYFAWYQNLPKKERDEYEGKKRRRKSKKEDTGFSFFVTLVWLAIVWLDGKWNLAFQDWTFNDWVYTWLYALFWVLLAAGIFGGMYLIYMLAKKIEI